MSTRSRDTTPSTALGDLADMWRSLLVGDWRSLAVVPSDHDTSLESVLQSLESVVGRSGAGPVTVVDARGSDVARGEQLARELQPTAREGRVIVFVDSVMRSLAGIPLLRDVDGVLLVVRVGVADPDSLTSTIAIVGRLRILGSVTISVPD